MRNFVLPLVLAAGFCAAIVLHVPHEFEGLIPAELEELNANFTKKQEGLLQDALLLLGEGSGDAVAFLKARDPELAKLVSPAFRSVEKKLDKMSPEATRFIGHLMEYLSAKPDDRHPDKNGNPKVPKEVHEISLAATWAHLENKTRTEMERVFPRIAKVLGSEEFDKHAKSEMSRNSWAIN
ncbi:hypothetical protein M3Y99_01079400 [Aphelenchoides fujianensis]|nr:hypothetical protein M3Y99_01079400 [Aphelenchoides fujianensis]